MLRALALLLALASLVWWSARLALGAWRERRAPAFALWRLFLAYLVASSSLLLAGAMLSWDPLIAATRAFAWPSVRIGEAVLGGLREGLPQGLVPLATIGLGLALVAILLLLDRRIRRLSGTVP